MAHENVHAGPSLDGTDSVMALRVGLSLIKLVCERETIAEVVTNQYSESGMAQATTSERKKVACGVATECCNNFRTAPCEVSSFLPRGWGNVSCWPL